MVCVDCSTCPLTERKMCCWSLIAKCYPSLLFSFKDYFFNSLNQVTWDAGGYYYLFIFMCHINSLYLPHYPDYYHVIPPSTTTTTTVHRTAPSSTIITNPIIIFTKNIFKNFETTITIHIPHHLQNQPHFSHLSVYQIK